MEGALGGDGGLPARSAPSLSEEATAFPPLPSSSSSSSSSSSVRPVTLLDLDLSIPELSMSERGACSVCGKRSHFYCAEHFTSTVPAGSAPLPVVRLPLRVDILRGADERAESSSAAHALVLAPGSCRIFYLPGEVPSYAQPARTLVLFPGPGSVTVRALPDLDAFDTVIIIDTTWQKGGKALLSTGIAAQPYTHVHIADYHTLFWRHQPLGAHCLSSIEATYFFLREFEEERHRRRSAGRGSGAGGAGAGGAARSVSVVAASVGGDAAAAAAGESSTAAEASPLAAGSAGISAEGDGRSSLESAAEISTVQSVAGGAGATINIAATAAPHGASASGETQQIQMLESEDKLAPGHGGLAATSLEQQSAVLPATNVALDASSAAAASAAPLSAAAVEENAVSPMAPYKCSFDALLALFLWKYKRIQTEYTSGAMGHASFTKKMRPGYIKYPGAAAAGAATSGGAGASASAQSSGARSRDEGNSEGSNGASNGAAGGAGGGDGGGIGDAAAASSGKRSRISPADGNETAPGPAADAGEGGAGGAGSGKGHRRFRGAWAVRTDLMDSSTAAVVQRYAGEAASCASNTIAPLRPSASGDGGASGGGGGGGAR